MNEDKNEKLQRSSGLLVSFVVIATLLGTFYLIYKNTQ
jgi:hypothetical protein